VVCREYGFVIFQLLAWAPKRHIVQ